MVIEVGSTYASANYNLRTFYGARRTSIGHNIARAMCHRRQTDRSREITPTIVVDEREKQPKTIRTNPAAIVKRSYRHT